MKKESINKIDQAILVFLYSAYKKIGFTLSVLTSLILVILLLWFFVYLISEKNWFNDLSSKNEIGDAFGGLTNPFISLIAVILTFCAFYVQYQFNIKQNQFYKKDKIDSILKEYNELMFNLANRYHIDFDNIAYLIDKSLNKLIKDYNKQKLVKKDLIIQIEDEFRREITKDLEIRNKYYETNRVISTDEMAKIYENVNRFHTQLIVLLKSLIKELHNYDVDQSEINIKLKFIFNKLEFIYSGSFYDNLLFIYYIHYLKRDLNDTKNNDSIALRKFLFDYYQIVDIKDNIYYKISNHTQL